ncbi:hypothetical protein [Bradyrhizobium sp. 62]|uniref:hypothetical protein n=1 Tax=Bradyrhizobium sp. 62 TaxID=1043588 RepID=UPI001FF9BAB9|nr:hypothetical protein [Bradyrhizobium sp. 62]MCK1364124.1 hypothetical protein [Bradyrhizobium sp. 62]
MDDRVRSLPSSDQERSKALAEIRRHNKLTDFGMKLHHLGVAVGLNPSPLVVENLGQLLDRLALLRRNLGGM